MQKYRALGAPPPDPHWPPAAGGSALAPPKQLPYCEFLATRLVGIRFVYFHLLKFLFIFFFNKNSAVPRAKRIFFPEVVQASK